MKIRQRFLRYKERLRFKYGTKIADLIVANATRLASRKMEQSGGISILMDNTVLGHGTTHKTGWVSTGPKQWGGQLLNTGYAARMPAHAPNNSILYKNICFLPGIASLAERGVLRLYTSAELRSERERQPAGRFVGYSVYDLNLFANLHIDSIDGHIFSATTAVREENLVSEAVKAQRERLKHVSDTDYELLVALLGEKNSQDAFHLLTAEKYELFCFLTMDFKFHRAWDGARKNKKFPLSTPVMTPEEFALYFGIKPVEPYLLSYKNASFPVNSDVVGPGKPGQ